MRHRVVVTGSGCVTPLGNNVEQMWDSLKRCANGVGPITHFPAEDFPTRFAAEVKDFSIADYVDDPERFVHSSPNILYAIGAATQAMTDSGLADGDFQPPRFGVYLGAGTGDLRGGSTRPSPDALRGHLLGADRGHERAPGQTQAPSRTRSQGGRGLGRAQAPADSGHWCRGRLA